MKIRFLGHAGFIIEDKFKIGIDPYDIKAEGKMDFIFITHAHYDHCSPEDIAMLADPGKTVIIAPPDCTEKIAALGARIVEVKPGREYNPGIKFRTIPAYNIGKPFHPKANNWVGYFFNGLEESVYHCGDTDNIPEMAGLRPDIFLVPVGGTYTMNAKDAAAAVEAVCPRRVIPMHYGKIVGSRDDAVKLQSLTGFAVDILEAE